MMRLLPVDSYDDSLRSKPSSNGSSSSLSSSSSSSSSVVCWRLFLVLTLVSCWGTLFTIYYCSSNPDKNFTSSTWNSASTVQKLRGASGGGGSSGASSEAEQEELAPSSAAACENSQAAAASSDNPPTPPSSSSTTMALAPWWQAPPSQPDSNQPPLVRYGDSIYLRGDWDAAPVVLEEHRLVFFTTAKVACTVFKQLFRRMSGLGDWNSEDHAAMLPWNPETNGLRYLSDYSPEEASDMMTSPNWTRAVFVREPKARLLSAYLDKAFHPTYLRDKCCPSTGSCVAPARASLKGFASHVLRFCDDAHWRRQSRRMGAKHWPTVNFVGHLESLEADARELLTRVGAWDRFGATGWGELGGGAIFAESSHASNGQKHATGAAAKLRQHYSNPDLVAAVESYYAEDYANPYLNITRIVL